MADNILSLLFKLGMDSSDAERASSQFGSTLSSHFGIIQALGLKLSKTFQSEIGQLTNSIPFVGRALAAITAELVSLAAAETASAAASTEATAAEAEQAVTATEAAAAKQALATAADEVAVSEEAAAAGAASFLGVIALVTGALLAVTAAAAVAAGGIFAASKAWADAGDQIYKAMLPTHLSAETLSVARVAANEMGISFENLVRGFARYEANISKAITRPTGDAALALKALHLSAEQLKTMTPDERLRALATALENVRDVSDRNRIAVNLITREFVNATRVTYDLGKGFDEARARTAALGQMFTGESARQARQFNQTLQDMKLMAIGLAISFGSQVGPQVTTAMREIISVVQLLMPVIRLAGQAVTLTLRQTITDIELLVIGFRMIPPTAALVVEALGVAARAFGQLGDTVKSAALGLLFFTQGDYATAMTMFGDAAEKATLVGREAVRQFGKEFEDFGKRARQIVVDVMTPPKLPTITEGGEDATIPPKPKKEKSQDADTRRKLKTLEDDVKEAERLYNDAIKNIEETFKDHSISMAQFVEQVGGAEEKLMTVRLTVYGAERAIIEQSKLDEAEKAERYRDLLEKTAAARDQYNRNVNEAQRKELIDEIEQRKEHAATIVTLVEQTGKNVVDMTRELARQRVITEEAAEERIINAEWRMLSVRQAQLNLQKVLAGENEAEQQKLKDAQEKLDNERAALTDATGARIQVARAKDTANLREENQRMRELRRQAEDDELNNQKQTLELLKLGYLSRAQLLAEQRKLEEREEALRHQRADEDIRREIAENNTRVQTEAARIVNDARLHRQLETEADRNRIAMQRIAEAYRQAQARLNPASRRSLFGDNFANAVEATGSLLQGLALTARDAFHSMSDAAGNMGTMLGNVFTGVVSGLQDLVTQWVRTGELSGKAVRQMVASILAQLAAQAIGKALWEVAEALAEFAIAASLAADPFTAFLAPGHIAAAHAHLAAAAAYGALGAGAAAIGRGVAGNAFAANSAGGGGASGPGGSGGTSSASSGPKVVEAGRAEYNVTIIVRHEPGTIIETVADNYASDGVLRKVLQNDGQKVR